MEAGEQWASTGWRLHVAFASLPNAVVPRAHVDLLRPLLPTRYSPIIPRTGVGAQAYLFEISEALYEEVMRLAGSNRK
jgi:hypothetical protein